MTMNSEFFRQLQDFVIEQSCVNDETITRETQLYGDLGIYGEDAVEFLIAFGKKFNVNVSKFMAADYFKRDGIDILGLECRKKVLTVGHLEKAITEGQLNEEIINS